MLEIIYSVFQPSGTDWETWNDSGFFLGFISLVAITLLFCALYYLVLGRGSRGYDTLGYWFLFLFLNSIMVFCATVGLCSFVAFENVEGLGAIEMDIWVFALWNSTLYAMLLFTVLSGFVFNRFSVHHKYIPFKFF
ncbi:MAG: hypothetical protein JKX84_07595 [Flavobacteriales bacterium]|nr:hypothetical protein [Flavobacteriales bacterium]